MDDMTILIVGAVTLALALGILLFAVRTAPAGTQQGTPAGTKKDKKERKVGEKDVVERASQYLTDRADELLKESSRSPVSARDLELANVNLTPGGLVVLVLAATLAVVVGVLALTAQPLLALIVAILVPVIAKIVLTVRIDRRRKAFADQMDDALQIIASALRAGLSFPAAVDAVAQNAEDPTGPEFARIINENRIGRDLIVAMSQTAERMDSEDFRWVTEAVATHRETGGNLNQIIERVAKTIRERKELRVEVEALAAEGKFSGIILMIVPVAVGGFFYIVNPSYAGKLLFTTTGQIVLGICLGLYIVAGVWIRKIVKVDY